MSSDNAAIKDKNVLLKGHDKTQVKQHIVYDANSRPILVFTTYIHTADGEPCSVTEYVYLSPTSTLVRDRQERVGVWNAAWEAGFTYDPATSYDPDGDGVL